MDAVLRKSHYFSEVGINVNRGKIARWFSNIVMLVLSCIFAIQMKKYY